MVDLYTRAVPSQLDPDLVIVQGGFARPSDEASVKQAIRGLIDQVRTDVPEAPLVVITSFRDSARQEAITARAWRGDPEILLLRPQPEKWPSMSEPFDGGTDDAGHATIATAVIASLREAGLVG